MEEESQKRAVQWVNQTTPNKIIQALQRLRDATLSARDNESANGGKQEVQILADQTTECIALVATNILSLRQWHYVNIAAASGGD